MPGMPLGRRRRADEIAEHIERAISTGEFKEGAAMPSEKELSERFGVGRPSVRQALFMLQPEVFIAHAPTKFDEKGRFTDEVGRQILAQQMTAFDERIRRIKSAFPVPA